MDNQILNPTDIDCNAPTGVLPICHWNKGRKARICGGDGMVAVVMGALEEKVRWGLGRGVVPMEVGYFCFFGLCASATLYV